MNNNNICHFIPEYKDSGSINIINFVLETKKQLRSRTRISSVYVMNYVISGKGTLYVRDSVFELKKGDIFFCLPSESYSIESGDNFKYMYISYIGRRANMIMDMLKINSKTCVFHGFEKLSHIWEQSIDVTPGLSGIRSEGILLYTFSCLKIEEEQFSKDKSDNAATRIKKYIDEYATTPEISIDKISATLSYNKKYISTTFKNKYKIGISNYINTVRIQAACSLMSKGISNITDIAYLCGFKDPLYFSKVFKNHLGCSPREYLSHTITHEK